MPVAVVIDKDRVDALEARENERFMAERPKSIALLERSRRTMPRGVPMSWMDDLYEHPPVFVAEGKGAYLTDVDGHSYLDIYVADTSAFCGHAPDPLHLAGVRVVLELGSDDVIRRDDSVERRLNDFLWRR